MESVNQRVCGAVILERTQISHKASLPLPNTHCIDSSRSGIHGIPSRVARWAVGADGDYAAFACWMRMVSPDGVE